ncbi:hypothetical protein LTS15_010991 [Exophiala xenobiotica]|nr:hypothetical protein LTS15_010991 [Exophiala xenobiotica]
MGNASSKNDIEAVVIPTKTLERLIDSIDKLSTAVTILNQTVSQSKKPEVDNEDDEDDDSISEPKGIGNKPIAIKSPWNKVDVLDDTFMAMEDQADLDEIDKLLKSSPHGPDLDVWKALPHLDWDYRRRLNWLSKDERGSNQGGPFIPTTIRYYANNHEERLRIQKILFLNLSKCFWHSGRRQSEEFSAIRGMLDMGPLVALIGTRLPKHRDLLDRQPSDPVTILRVLIEMLRMIPQEKNDWEIDHIPWVERATLGDLLKRCYQRKILVQPGKEDLYSHKLHSGYAGNAMLLINNWSWFTYISVSDALSVDGLRSLSLMRVWQYSQTDDERRRPFEKAPSDSFRSRDLCADVLRNVCKIQIEWTALIGEHLDLDIENSTLKVFCFGFVTDSLPIFHFCPFGGPLVDELRNTYSLLFRSLNDSYATNLAEYGCLPVPEWLLVQYGDENGLLSRKIAKNMSYFINKERPWLSDTEFHVEPLKKPMPPIQLFER